MADQDDYKHGEMNTDVQEKTFDGFMKWSTNVGIICIVIIIGLAIFAT
jgi:hypothetical protein